MIQGAPFYDRSPRKPSDLDLADLPSILDEKHILAPVTTPKTPASPGNEMGECSTLPVMFVVLKLSVMTIGIL